MQIRQCLLSPKEPCNIFDSSKVLKKNYLPMDDYTTVPLYVPVHLRGQKSWVLLSSMELYWQKSYKADLSIRTYMKPSVQSESRAFGTLNVP